ncbi:uncharacterized protein LOC113778442 [Coffea eugenioides]|uniref:uncharacterized protein LOC113778442 n=1 Tax=Coffea eugenioides TaxID=49369 RepID=UPI000F615DCD|nr:uncharacterized protein LOC113778442 [Coffea eugenioides]
MFVSPHLPDAPLPHFIPDIYGPLPCCFTIRFTKNKTLRLPHDLIPMIQHCRQPFLTIKAKNAHWLIALTNLQFAEGWNHFAADHKLATGDIILFKYLANMEFNVAIFKKNYQQQTFPDPFSQMHFDRTNCVYQQVITGLSNDFTQDLTFPAFFHRVIDDDTFRLKLPFNIIAPNWQKNRPFLIHLHRQQIHARLQCTDINVTQHWIQFLDQIHAKPNELLFFLPTEMLTYQVIVCAQNGIKKYVAEDTRRVLQSYRFETAHPI